MIRQATSCQRSQTSGNVSLYIGDRVRARGSDAAKADRISIRAKADTLGKPIEIVLIEKDGSNWSGEVLTTNQWNSHEVALDKMTFSRSMILPTPFPGLWSYWRIGPANRTFTRIRPDQIEPIELRINKSAGSSEGSAVMIGAVDLHYSGDQ